MIAKGDYVAIGVGGGNFKVGSVQRTYTRIKTVIPDGTSASFYVLNEALQFPLNLNKLKEIAVRDESATKTTRKVCCEEEGLLYIPNSLITPNTTGFEAFYQPETGWLIIVNSGSVYRELK